MATGGVRPPRPGLDRDTDPDPDPEAEAEAGNRTRDLSHLERESSH